jgi:hypothetical protein
VVNIWKVSPLPPLPPSVAHSSSVAGAAGNQKASALVGVLSIMTGGNVKALAFAPRGTCLAIGGAKTLLLWEVGLSALHQ